MCVVCGGIWVEVEGVKGLDSFGVAAASSISHEMSCVAREIFGDALAAHHC